MQLTAILADAVSHRMGRRRAEAYSLIDQLIVRCHEPNEGDDLKAIAALDALRMAGEPYTDQDFQNDCYVAAEARDLKAVGDKLNVDVEPLWEEESAINRLHAKAENERDPRFDYRPGNVRLNDLCPLIHTATVKINGTADLLRKTLARSPRATAALRAAGVDLNL